MTLSTEQDMLFLPLLVARLQDHPQRDSSFKNLTPLLESTPLRFKLTLEVDQLVMSTNRETLDLLET